MQISTPKAWSNPGLPSWCSPRSDLAVSVQPNQRSGGCDRCQKLATDSWLLSESTDHLSSTREMEAGVRTLVQVWRYSMSGASGAAVLVAAFAIGFGLAPRWPAQTAVPNSGLPTPQEVEARFVAALGGKDAILRPHSMTIKGTDSIYRTDGTRVDTDLLIYAAPFKRLEKVKVPGRGEYLSGYDGQVAWAMKPSTTPEVLEGDIVQSIRRDADLYYWSHVMDYFRSMDTLEVTEFGGHRCYHLTGINKWGKRNDHFYDKDTGLLVGYEFQAWDASGKSSEQDVSHQIFEDYKKIGDVLMPMRTVSKKGGRIVEEVQHTSVTLDDVDDSVFALPEAARLVLEHREPTSRK